MRTWLAVLSALGVTTGCLSARSVQRNYYILHTDTVRSQPDQILGGHLYVSDLACERIYDKEQLVLRRSPYVVRYSREQLWATKPSRMISDIVAESFISRGTFSTVSRMLAEGRPTFSIGGNLRALEVRVERDPWEVRIAFDLEMVRFDGGELLWSFAYEGSRPVPVGDFDGAVEQASKLLEAGLAEAVSKLESKAQSKAFLERAFGRNPPGR
ncbi:MAG TPA: ABC-type transport auxiliary lipoprotein family protein [Myxococcales bacterium LLY-WYZ-16_1]|nr:ABC-type transport auxiliary lipoprotein family protein [Myxococcales bacterium LLY-WYZ-16_1]